ncbi:solute carrier family 28 member 3, partial [Ictidomys tridecemlineatus]
NEELLENQDISGNSSIRSRVVQSREQGNTKQGEELVNIEQDSLRKEEEEDMEDDRDTHQKGCKLPTCVLNFHRALPLFGITVAAIFFVVWDHLMAKYEHRIDEIISPGKMLLNSHWFWLKWVIWSLLILGIIFWLIFDTAKLGQQQLVSFGGLIMYIILLFIFSKYPTRVLPIVVFFSTVMSMLYYMGLMQWIIRKVGWIMLVTMGSSPVESLVAAGNIFVGQTESPLLVRPYLPYITKSELHAIMTAGFATIAGSVLGAYISFGVSSTHLLTASVMSAPASLAVAKLFWPETEKSKITLKNAMKMEIGERNFMSSEKLPKCKLVPGHHQEMAGSDHGSIGVYACLQIRSETIATYALCGFANFGSLGIVIGGLTSLAPGRKRDIVAGSVRALIAGTVACFMTACVAGILSGTPEDINCHHILENAFSSSLPGNATTVVSCCQSLLSSITDKEPRGIIPGGNYNLYFVKSCCKLLNPPNLNCSWIPDTF